MRAGRGTSPAHNPAERKKERERGGQTPYQEVENLPRLAGARASEGRGVRPFPLAWEREREREKESLRGALGSDPWGWKVFALQTRGWTSP